MNDGRISKHVIFRVNSIRPYSLFSVPFAEHCEQIIARVNRFKYGDLEAAVVQSFRIVIFPHCTEEERSLSDCKRKSVDNSVHHDSCYNNNNKNKADSLLYSMDLTSWGCRWICLTNSARSARLFALFEVNLLLNAFFTPSGTLQIDRRTYSNDEMFYILKCPWTILQDDTSKDILRSRSVRFLESSHYLKLAQVLDVFLDKAHISR